MPTDRHLDNRISSWLEADAPTQLPDRVLRATFERTRQTRQQGRWQQVLRRLQMNRMIFGLGGAAVVVLAAVLALGIYFNQPGAGAPPSPSPTTQPTPAPTGEPTSAPTADPTASPRPMRTPDAGLPVGPFSFEPDGAFSPKDSGMTLTVTIPASGWTFDRTWNLLGKGPGDSDPFIAFWAFPDEQFYVPSDPCRVDSTRPDTPATTVDVMIGRYAGKSLILHAPEDVADAECERGRVVTYVAASLDFERNTQRPDEVSELWILDVDGTTVIIDALSSPDTPAELVEELRGVVESTTFETP